MLIHFLFTKKRSEIRCTLACHLYDS